MAGDKVHHAERAWIWSFIWEKGIGKVGRREKGRDTETERYRETEGRDRGERNGKRPRPACLGGRERMRVGGVYLLEE